MAQVWLVTGSSRGLGRAIVEAGLAAGLKGWRQLGTSSLRHQQPCLAPEEWSMSHWPLEI
jgi:hypothetical protein